MLSLKQMANALGGDVSGGQVLCPGPGHSPKDRSLSVKLADNKDGFVVHSHAGDPWDKCKEFVRSKIGAERYKPNGKSAARSTVEQIYEYQDETGATLFEVLRFEPKGFRQRRPDGKGGHVWNMEGVRRVPYRLPELLEGIANERPVFLTEGEKAAHALLELGLTVTCSPGGAGKWRDDYAEHFKGANVIVLPDNDEPGEKHAKGIVQSLSDVAAKVLVVRLPGLPDKGDAHDWVASGGGAEQLQQLVETAQQATIMEVPAPEEAELDREQLETSAQQIIECANVLERFAGVWRKLVAGEEKNAKLLYLVGTSRLFAKSMNAAVKGPSSGGKSEIRRKVLGFFPPEDVVSFTTLSEKALLYYEDDFAHKILSMGEAAGTEEQTLQDYLLRELISEGHLCYPVPQKLEGKGIVTVNIEKNGPVAFMVTTTKAALHPENETRMTSLEVDDSSDQTVSVLSKIAQVVGMNAEETTVGFEAWQDFQRWLAAGNRKVVIPFAEDLAKAIPPRSVRLRRDFAQVLIAIKAHALLHRSHREVDRRGQIVADIENDYRTVAELMGGIVAEASGTSIQKEIQQTIDAVAEATADLADDEGATADKIAKILQLDKSSAWRRLKKTALKGYIVNLETRRGQPGRFRVSNEEVEAEPLLPAPEALEVTVQPAQSCNPARKAQTEQEANRLHDRLRGPCNPSPVDTGCNPHATGHATGQPHENIEELATGCTVAPVARGDMDCQACDGNQGKGCPTCKPENYGLPPRRKEPEVQADDLSVPEFLRRTA